VARFSLKILPEVFVSTSATSAPVSRAVVAGKLRKLGSRLYTTNLTEEPSSLVRRYLWDIAAGFFPGGLVADRTALEHAPAPDGSVFLVAARGGNVALPGITLRARRGAGPQPDDFTLRDNLHCMSTARALLENIRPTRARQGAARTLKRAEIETWLEHFLRNGGKERLNALRDQIKRLAPRLKLEPAGRELDDMIGALLGTREATLRSPTAKARARGTSYDPRRVELFENLHDALRKFPPEPVRPWHPTGQAAINQAFFEAYFSNFIEGTEFAVDEARAIVFDGVIPQNRPADAHDVLGTFRIVSNAREMNRLPQSPETFLELLRSRHRTIMEGRPHTSPGQFKDRPNQFGAFIFVAPEDVRGTLIEGFRIHQRLSEPLHRAIFIMFLVAEVHPFNDGNGRVARIMMNAELAAAQQVRVLIPIIYRSNYLSALRSLSTGAWPEPIIKTLVFAQRYVAAVPWDDLSTAIAVLARTHAFIRPDEGDDKGIRLRIPDAADIATARDDNQSLIFDAEHARDVDDSIVFWASDGDKRIRFRIRRATLDDHFSDGGCLRFEAAFNKHRRDIEAIARRQYLLGRRDPDGSVLISINGAK
jgi:fido (protein-threonine AMPylation protein)